MKRVLLDAGKSAQATLNGNDHQTYESVYTPYFLYFIRTPREIVPEDVLAYAAKITKRRARLTIDAILDRGFITTEQIRGEIGQKQPPRAAQDAREAGLPLLNHNFTMPDGTKHSYYVFDLDDALDEGRLLGRKKPTKLFKKEMIRRYGRIHAFTGEPLPERVLQIDHRVPYAVAGDSADGLSVDDFMFLDAEYQRRKSASCEKCTNFEDKDADVCRGCYWASPESYSHSAGSQVRHLAVSWQGHEVDVFDAMRRIAAETSQTPQDFVKSVCSREIWAVTAAASAVAFATAVCTPGDMMPDLPVSDAGHEGE
jgi:hypothetical protein